MGEKDKKPVAFVIQAFDEGRFDRRYQETIKPGIVAGGAEPQRADEFLGVTPIIHKIEQGIREADICVAEVSEDNPNVWLELGYALALNRPTLILCDRGMRSKLPFDVAHRPVIFYSTESRSGYDELERRISAEVKNLAREAASEAKQPILQTGATDTAELKGYEVSLLAALLATWSSSPAGASGWDIQRKLEKTDYTETQIAMGLSKLVELGYIQQDIDRESEHQYFVYRIAPQGIQWIHRNEASIKPLVAPPSAQRVRSRVVRDDFADDDIPF